jgi:plastocyanin
VAQAAEGGAQVRRIVFMGLVFAMTSCLLGPAPLAAARASQARPSLPVEVQIWHLKFGPVKLHVTKATRVTWRSYSLGTHSSKSFDGLWNSGPIKPGGSFTYTFRRVGTWEYRCTFDPRMQGRVVVTSG